MRRLPLALALASGLALWATPAAAQVAPSLTLRDRLVLVSSGSSAAVAQSLVRGFTERHGDANAPILHSIGSTRALEVFCGGTGPQTPDVALVTRRMPRAMLDVCQGNGVRDIVEMEMGLGAVVLAVRRGEAAPALTSRHVWEALAAERATDDEFVPNRVRLWSDLQSSLPRQEIRVLVPDAESGTRALFDDLVMESGCRHVKQIRLVFESSYRRAKCVTHRTDGRVTEIRSRDLAAALLAAPPGTIGVLGFDQVMASGGNLVPLSLDGVAPTPAAIASADYEQTRVLYLYAKRQHSRNLQGVGVVRGIHELMAEAASESASGPGGYLTLAGLLPLGPAERAAQRRIAHDLTPMSR